MEFKKGDRVKFLNDEGEGKVVDFPKSGWLLVEDKDGFTYEHPAEELVKVENWNKEFEKYQSTQPDIIDIVERNLDQNVARKATEEFKVLYKNKEANTHRRKGDTIEVDLHIHELLDRHDRMSNAEIIQVQLEHFERTLRLAEEKKISKVIYIHGIGQGVLRAEIRKMLSNYYPNCEFMDGPYHEYGFGATEVRIRRH